MDKYMGNDTSNRFNSNIYNFYDFTYNSIYW